MQMSKGHHANCTLGASISAFWKTPLLLTPCSRSCANGKSRLQEAQEDVEEVKGIMLENMNKAEERSGKLVDLEDRADELLRKSKTFEKKSNQVKEKTRWKNKKMKIVLIGVAVVVALVVIGLIIFFTAT
ncbi:vesicle-associated membrane protein 5 isoform X3 [Stigmatopora argus]